MHDKLSYSSSSHSCKIHSVKTSGLNLLSSLYLNSSYFFGVSLQSFRTFSQVPTSSPHISFVKRLLKLHHLQHPRGTQRTDTSHLQALLSPPSYPGTSFKADRLWDFSFRTIFFTFRTLLKQRRHHKIFNNIVCQKYKHKIQI